MVVVQYILRVVVVVMLRPSASRQDSKKRINVGGGGGGDQQIHPNVFDTSDSTAMTHEQRTHAKVRSFVRRREEEGAVGRSVFFLMCLLSSPGVFPNQREEGDLSSARRGSDI